MMDERFQAELDTAAERHAPGKHIRMPSGAGHDAQYLARKIPAAMLFVPSIGGISHHWSENTSDEDIVLGAQVFADAIASVLRAWASVAVVPEPKAKQSSAACSYGFFVAALVATTGKRPCGALAP